MGVLNLGSLKYIVTNTLIGEITILWDDADNTFKQVILPDVITRKQNFSKMKYSGVLLETHPNSHIREFISKIKQRVLGHDVEFDLDELDLSDQSEFQKKVLQTQTEIPYGKVTTYKYLAKMIGKPRNARPVANVLSSNPFPLVIPCHRIVLSNWKLGGYAGSSNGLFKGFILSKEGVELENLTVKKKYRYTPRLS